MSKQIFANNASSLLAASIDDNDLTIQVASSAGALYPAPGAGEFFLATLINADGDIEIVKIESRTGDLLTVAAAGRGQEGTSAAAWTNGLTRVELRNTKGTMDRFLQREGDEMTGDLDMNGNEVQEANLTGDWKGTAGQLVGTKIRGTEDDASNEIDVPSDGSQATASGSPILTVANTELARTAVFEIGMIMEWFGAAIDCPAGWAICDGSSGTPDMRDKVSVGVSGSKPFNSTGGSETASGNTSAAGDHTHGGVTGDTAISIAQMPAHDHGAVAGTITLPMSSDDNSQAPYTRLEGSSGGADGTAAFSATIAVGSQGGGAGHNHSIGASGTHSHSFSGVSTLQPYRALYKIMFIGF